MKTLLNQILIFLLAGLFSCSSDSEQGAVNAVDPIDPPENFPNILLIIADDMGKDATFGFDQGILKPQTPNINAIKNTGVSFQNFWSYPTCSPTRATVITGKYGYRTGVKWAGDILVNSETSLQQYIDNQTNGRYKSAVVGKWHLSGNTANFNPLTFGLDYYAGILGGSVQNYFQWDLTTNGSTSSRSGYTSKVFTDLAIDWVEAQSSPWFLWLAFNAPHTPFHRPPAIMHNQGNLPNYSDGMDPMPYYLAAIEAMDFQIGRFLNGLSQQERDNTVIIFMGDNGTPNQAGQSPYANNAVKGSLYQGGINVPLFVSGQGVQRTADDFNLINSTDLFSTIAQLAGVSASEIHDSKSFKHLLTAEGNHREFQYSEMNAPNANKWTIANGHYKLIQGSDGLEELYNLESDPYETIDLIPPGLSQEAIAEKEALEAALFNIFN